MNDYQDRWSRYHDKPCRDGVPSSNNGWIYTAYAQKLGLPTEPDKLEECFRFCVHIASKPMVIYRSPGKPLPPLSRDEILGMFWVGCLTTYWLEKKLSWNFSPFPIPPFNFFKTVAALWRMKGAHRNAVWENGGEPHLFRFAFSVPIQDRVYMLRMEKKKVPLLWSIYEKLSRLVPSKSDSSKLIQWRKGKCELSPQLFDRYFGPEHPFSKIQWQNISIEE